MNRNERILAGSLLTVTAALLVVGIVSGTMIRHIIQVVPIVAALTVVSMRREWSRAAAIPVLAFWLFCMTLVWLHLLGVAHVITGRFPPAEVLLTIVIGGSCLTGLVASKYVAGSPRWGASLVVFLLSGALQFGLTLLSMTPAIANR